MIYILAYLLAGVIVDANILCTRVIIMIYKKIEPLSDEHIKDIHYWIGVLIGLVIELPVQILLWPIALLVELIAIIKKDDIYGNN